MDGVACHPAASATPTSRPWPRRSRPPRSAPPPRPSARAYETLDASRVRGAGSRRLLTDLVALVRFATHQEGELVPFAETVAARFASWLADQERQGRRFTDEQREWLALIRDHIAANLAIEPDDFDTVPFNLRGGLGKVDDLFGEELGPLLDELNGVLVV